MTYGELEAWFLNDSEPLVEQIQGAPTDVDGESIASLALLNAGLAGQYRQDDVYRMVCKFRE